jgi:septal ring factor EnvC (AmiA/AmiB activator)
VKLTVDQPEIPARDELRAVEEALAARRQELAELQAEQPSDSVTITTMKEELEALIATLTARRDALARQLEDASRLGE